jgi:hypothetical protein
MLLRLVVAATSLAPRPPDGVSTKLTVEAMRELITLAENKRGEACSSDRGVSGNARLRRCGAISLTTSPHSLQR